MNNKSLILLVAMLMVMLWVSSPQAGVTKYAQAGMAFLKIDPDGRSAGMGSAVTAMADNSMAMFSNPAGMGFTSGWDLAMTQTNWIADIKHYAIGASYGFANIGTFGLNVVYMDYGDMKRTVPYSGSDPTLKDIGYLDLGTFTVGEYAIGLSYSRQISSQFSIGGTVKFVRQDLSWSETLDVSSGQKVTTDNIQDLAAFDFGTLYYTGWKDLRLGMSVRNFSQQGRYVDQRFELPLTMTIGVAMNVMSIWTDDTMHKLNVALDWSHPRDYEERLHLGFEYVLAEMLAVRAGYKFNYDEEGLTFGVGIDKKFGSFGIRFDYAYGAFGDFFNQVHRTSFAITL